MTDRNSTILKLCELGEKIVTADSIPCKSFWTKPSIFMHELLQLFVSMAATVYGDNAPIKLNYMYTELYVSVVDLLLFVWSRTDLTCFFLQPPALSTFTYLTRWDPSKTKKISSDKCGIRICLRLQFSELTFLFSLF